MKLRQTAERILNRPIHSSEGFKASEVGKAISHLENEVPKELLEFHTLLGNNKLFTDGFQHFISLSELYLIGNKLIFLHENQGAVSWAVDVTNNAVYQTTDLDAESEIKWYREEFKLLEFLELMLYFQAVMADDYYHEASESNLFYFASIELDGNQVVEKKTIQNFLETQFEVAIKGKTITVYKNDEAIIMKLSSENDPSISYFASFRTLKYLKILMEKYGFSEL